MGLHYIHEDERRINYCGNDDCDVRILIPYYVVFDDMKAGDLVICKYVEGKPIGVILNVRWRKVGRSDRLRIYDVFVKNGIFPFRPHTVEAANESR